VEKFNFLINVHVVHNFRQKDTHTAESLLPETRVFEVGIAVGKFGNYKSTGTDQIPAELIKAGGENLSSESYRNYLRNYLFYME
jgi:hypothetical protein